MLIVADPDAPGTTRVHWGPYALTGSSDLQAEASREHPLAAVEPMTLGTTRPTGRCQRS